jgi:ABC-type sugar transport systems, permease components
MRRTKGEILLGIAYLSPALALLLAFTVLPMAYALGLSLTSWDGLSPAKEFVGAANYLEALRSPDFWRSLWITLRYTLGFGLGSMAAGLGAALMLNREMLGRDFFRALFFLPVVTSTIAIAVAWRYLFDPAAGYVNRALRVILDQAGPRWLNDPGLALPVMMFIGAWKRFGFNMVVYLAALQSISPELYESADLDGAGAGRRLRSITLPLLAGTTGMLATMSVIEAFLAFDQVYVMTNGGPLGATEVIGLQLYKAAFSYHRAGYGSALAWLVFVIALAFSIAQRALSREKA